MQSKSQTDGPPDRHNSCLAEIHQLSLERVIALMAAADSSSNGSGKDQSLERAAVEVNGRLVTLKWEIYRENSSRKANSFAVQLHPVFFRFQTTVFHSHLRTVLFTKRAQADAKKRAIAAPKLKKKAKALLNLLASDPFQQPPPQEALVGDVRGAFSLRTNIQHRLVYQVVSEERMVKVMRLCSHYS